MKVSFGSSAVSVFALLAALPAAVPSSALAQDGDAASQQDESETIVVTARRREEALSDVPASIDVFGSAELEKQGVFDFADLAQRAPNVYIFENTGNPAQTGVTIRGIPNRTGIYVDDVFVGDASGFNQLLLDVERIEIIRGPQSTLFGRDSLSGAINTITRKPGDEFEASVLARYGNYNYRQLGGAISGPLTDKISGKVTGGWRAQESFNEVEGLGDDFDTIDEYALAGQLKVDVTETFELLFNVDYLNNSQVTGLSDVSRDFPGPSFFAIGANDASPTDRVLPGLNQLNMLDREVASGYVRAEWELGNWDIRSITAFRDNEFDVARDPDGSAFDLLRGEQNTDFEQFSQEVIAFYDNGSNFNGQIGVFYFDSERTFTDINDTYGDFPLTVLDEATIGFIDAGSPEDITGLLAPFNPGAIPGVVTIGRAAASPTLQAVDPLLGLLAGAALTDEIFGRQTTFDTQELESIAVFGQGSWRPTERLELTAGLRYTSETNNAEIGFEALGATSVFFGGISELGPFASPEEKDSIFSPSGSIRYDVSEQVNVYFTSGQGFRSGGFNTAPPDPGATEFGVDRSFEPEIVTSYEIGVKSDLADNRIAFNAAAFIQDYKDFQRSITRIDSLGNRFTETENTSASIWGLELDAEIDVTNNFFITAAYGYQDSEYDDFPALVNTVGAGIIEADLTGEPLPFVPTHSANITASYEVPIGTNFDLRIGADLQYRSEYRVTDAREDASDPEVFVDDTTILNANLAITHAPSQTTFAVRGFNLTDEEFVTGVDFNTFAGAVYQSLSEPTTWTVELSKRF
ncbi:MAG: TonB-dependent receptor [Pseudomonadota bacterium]